MTKSSYSAQDGDEATKGTRHSVVIQLTPLSR